MIWARWLMKSRIIAHDQRTGPELRKACEGCVDLSCGACAQDVKLNPERARGVLRRSRFGLDNRVGRIDQHCDNGCIWQQFMQNLELLSRQIARQDRHAREVAAGAAEAGSEAELHRVDTGVEDDRDGRGCRLGGKRRGRAGRNNPGHPAVDQIGRQRRQSVILAVCKTIFDRHVLAFDVAGLFQALSDAGQPHDIGLG